MPAPLGHQADSNRCYLRSQTLQALPLVLIPLDPEKAEPHCGGYRHDLLATDSSGNGSLLGLYWVQKLTTAVSLEKARSLQTANATLMTKSSRCRMDLQFRKSHFSQSGKTTSPWLSRSIAVPKLNDVSNPLLSPKKSSVHVHCWNDRFQKKQQAWHLHDYNPGFLEPVTMTTSTNIAEIFQNLPLKWSAWCIFKTWQSTVAVW